MEQGGAAGAIQPLFRHEAMLARQNPWLGRVVLEPRRSHRAFALFALIVAVAIVGLFFLRDVTRSTRVSGWLMPDAGLVKVYAPREGAVAELRVKEGAAVRKGDQLLTLSAEVTSASGATQGEIVRQLQARKQMLGEQKVQTQRLLDQQLHALSGRLAAYGAELGPIEQELAAQRSRLALARGTEARMRDLQRQGYISLQHLQQVEETRLTQTGRLAGLERERIAVVRDRLALESDLKDLPIKARNEMSGIDREIAAIDQQLAEAEALRANVVTAPQDGTVTAILAGLGGHVNTAGPLLTIVPGGSLLEAHLYAPSRAIGFVQPGQQVYLRYQAYPYEKFGHYAGTVTAVSGAAISPADLPFSGIATPGNGNGEPVYRITVALAEQTVKAYGRPVPLQPGMQLEADLALDKRRLYEWVLDPLYAISGKLAR
ncbi:MAG TPA: HlyD family efflux transporter periplasmic adaptor subunit [Azospira sp.]|nr:HlyD family efflux transporter periplasmic adaptor subunit [Azospira sp.]